MEAEYAEMRDPKHNPIRARQSPTNVGVTFKRNALKVHTPSKPQWALKQE